MSRQTEKQETPPPERKLSTKDLIGLWFDPRQLSEDQAKRLGDLRDGFKLVTEMVIAATKPGPDQTAAIRKLRESFGTCQSCISIEEFTA